MNFNKINTMFRLLCFIFLIAYTFGITMNNALVCAFTFRMIPKLLVFYVWIVSLFMLCFPIEFATLKCLKAKYSIKSKRIRNHNIQTNKEIILYDKTII